MGPLVLTRVSHPLHIGLVVAVIALEISGEFLVNAQNCEFSDDVIVDKTAGDAWVIRADAISEKTKEGDIVWNVGTANVLSVEVFQRPHHRYLKGFRYSARYVYKASAYFPEFLETEGVTELQRNVTFTCADKPVKIHFKFPLTDVNDPPEFTAQPKDNLQVDLKEVKENDIINGGLGQEIIIRDPDFTSPNNQIKSVESDRPELIIAQLVEGEWLEGQIGRSNRVNLKLNLGAGDIRVGIYSLNLICSDGQFTSSTRIGINIYNSTLN